MNGKTARLIRKLARNYRGTRGRDSGAYPKTWKRRWAKLNHRERGRARRAWAHELGVRLPA